MLWRIFDTFAAAEQDVEYELEEVWDGAKWHVIHKMLPKKTDTGNFVLFFFYFAVTHLLWLTYFQTAVIMKHTTSI